MRKRKITLNNSSFFVKDVKIARNYSDVSGMFSCFKNFNITNDSVIFDIGANIGIFSLSYSLLYKESQVYSFEPVPFIYDTLVTNVNLNGTLKPRIRTFNFGFSDSERYLELSIPTPLQHKRYEPQNDINWGLYSIHGKGKKKIKGYFITLDDFCAKQSINRIDLIKIDVEGHEFEVLTGAKKTIEKKRPIIYMEFNDLTKTLSEHSVNLFENFFREYNYLIYGLEKGQEPYPKQFTTLDETDNVTDLICVLRDT